MTNIKIQTKDKIMKRFKYKNNLYKTDGVDFWVISGENNLYISKITNHKMIGILNNFVMENNN